MNNSLQIFHFNSNRVRVEVDEHGNPWFCGKDVCDILGYANTRDAIARHCQAKGVVKRDTLVTCDVGKRDVTSREREYQRMTFLNLKERNHE